jgi:hypothetical protein
MAVVTSRLFSTVHFSRSLQESEYWTFAWASVREETLSARRCASK